MTGADEQIGMAREDERQGIGTFQAGQGGGGGFLGRHATREVEVEELGD